VYVVQSIFTLQEVIGEGAKDGGFLAESFESAMRFPGKTPGFGPRFLEADHSGISRLLRGNIFARALPELFRGLSYIENVVDDREGEVS